MDKKIELQVAHITNSQEQASAYAMILQEVDGDRQMPIIIGSAEAQSIALILKNIKAPRPLTHDLFVTCLGAFAIKVEEALIYRAKEGVFYSYIFLRKGDTTLRIDARSSDAIGLAVRSNCPIYVYESILESEKVRFNQEGTEKEGDPEGFRQTSFADTLQDKSLSSLKKELEKAVKEENYELASLLRDEISRRQ